MERYQRHRVAILLWFLYNVKYSVGDDTAQDGPLQCYQCTNYDATTGRIDDSVCPKNVQVDTARAYSDDCSNACFTRSVTGDERKVIRNCAALYNMAEPLPPDGCYTDWDGTVICICRTSYCNAHAIGNSTESIEDLLDQLIRIDPSLEKDGIKLCYDCISKDQEGTMYDHCPKDGRVKRTAMLSPCNGTCFTRTSGDDPDFVARGCSDTQYNLPNPLPTPGCYDRTNGEVWCVCEGSRCNGNAMGTSSGVDFYNHLKGNVVPPVPGVGLRCYNCINYDREGNHYPQCPKHGWVLGGYMVNCSGSCFTHSDDLDDRLVYRGCTDTQPALPVPPTDGCYTYYSATYCLCRTSGCNGGPIGEPQPIELDAHLKDGNGANFLSRVGTSNIALLVCVMASLSTRLLAGIK